MSVEEPGMLPHAGACRQGRGGACWTPWAGVCEDRRCRTRPGQKQRLGLAMAFGRAGGADPRRAHERPRPSGIVEMRAFLKGSTATRALPS
ncbi:MAG: hypothetical protein ACLT98_07110 [Eggerthellaceae bacterium]